ncbi:hypothetical protein GBAR_LOCUS22438 [Geodia barretti]|uniref:Uncharacterized protein n=1 Tax=Geodia barretti TaxID=519541 RepID=A0AA35X131_GEOBA|nr:hypothetical protein GBAR_LOCUS22438 [Geodia barretti]
MSLTLWVHATTLLFCTFLQQAIIGSLLTCVAKALFSSHRILRCCVSSKLHVCCTCAAAGRL